MLIFSYILLAYNNKSGSRDYLYERKSFSRIVAFNLDSIIANYPENLLDYRIFGDFYLFMFQMIMFPA